MSDPQRWNRTERWQLVLIVSLAFALRLVAVLQYESGHPNAEHLSIDEASYDAWARAIAGGDWIGRDVFFQEPLYSYWVGALYSSFGAHLLVVRVFQCLLWAATAALAGSLARRLFGRVAGLLAALALALYWPGVLFPAFLLKENLFLPLFALLALVLVATRAAEEDPAAPRRARRLWLAAGMLAGLGALLRGNMLALLPALALWPVVRTWRRGNALGPAAGRARMFLAGSACVLLPVALRNLDVGGVFLLTTSGAGTNLYGGNNLENPYGRASEPGFVRGIPEHEAADWRREAERRLSRPLGPAGVSAFWRGETLRSMRAHPREHLAILWNKLRLSLGRYEVPDDHCLYWDARYVTVARLPLPGFGILGVFGLAGLLLLAIRSRWGRTAPVSSLPPSFDAADPGAAVEVALLFLAYLGTIVLTVTSDRARLPLVPLLAPFAGWALVWTGRAATSRCQGALVRLAPALFVGVLAVHVRTLPDSEIAEDLDERDHNLAVQLLRDEGRTDEARAIAERLVREHSRSARARILLSEIDFRDAAALTVSPDAAARGAGRAQLDAALAQVEPFAREPSLNARERFHAASLCAWIQLERGAWAEAAAAFRQARAFDGEARELREGLARAQLGAADAGPVKEGRAGAEAALALLHDLRSTAPDTGEAAGLEGLLALAEYLRGRAILEEPAVSDEERKLGQTSLQAALTRLQPLAGSMSIAPDVSWRCRLLAGVIQLYRRNWKPAESHFRSALALHDDPEAQLGLLQALLGALEEEPQSDGRSSQVEEAGRLLDGLAATDPDAPAIPDLRHRFELLR